MVSSDIYIIAEIGNNHQGDLKHALKLMKAAKECGADAVKTQKRDNKTLYTKSFFNEKYDNPNSFGLTYGEHREKLELKKNDYKELKEYSDELKIDFFATPFDLTSLEFLEEFNFPAYKIASADITNTILQTEIAKTKKEIFLSTGGGTLEDVKRAKNNIYEHNKKLSILQCTASYPASIEDMNLKVIETYSKHFPGIRLGLSDHENGIDAGPIAYMLGARVFEKHFTLNRANKGTDNAFSLEPQEMKNLCIEVKNAWQAKGKIFYGVTKSEKKSLRFRRSLYFTRDLSKGEKISENDIKSLRPAIGLKPKFLKEIINKKTSKKIKSGTPVNWHLIKI